MCLHSTSWLILMSRAEPKKFDSSEIPAAKCTLPRCADSKRKVTLVELKFHLLSVSATSETVAAAGSSSASNCSIQRSQLYSPRLYSLFCFWVWMSEWHFQLETTTLIQIWLKFSNLTREVAQDVRCFGDTSKKKLRSSISRVWLLPASWETGCSPFRELDGRKGHVCVCVLTTNILPPPPRKGWTHTMHIPQCCLV